MITAQLQVPLPLQTTIDSLIETSVTDSIGFKRLTHLVDTFGPRLSGSRELEEAIDWIVETMQTEQYDTVWKQPVMVPNWKRGNESATLTLPYEKNLPMLGLGGSIGTPKRGIEAEVLVVSSFEELKERGEEAAGRIVVYNVPFTTYGQTVTYRLNGAVEAARVGAVASLVRSIGPYGMQTPHTGNSRYQEGIDKIPHAAITMEDAMLLQRLQDRGVPISIQLYMEAQTHPDTLSHNIIAEIRGSHFPEEIIVVGGHIDSWDVGQGAMDDAGGCVAAWEIIRLLKESDITPKRTIRVVLWTNEENGLRGAKEYHRWVKEDEQSLDRHVLAIESDSGIFDPIGFGYGGDSDEAVAILSAIGKRLEPIGSGEITLGGGGADIGPLMQDGVPGMGLRVDRDRYFWYHHTHADTIDKLTIEDFNACVATVLALTYGVADWPVRLPR